MESPVFLVLYGYFLEDLISRISYFTIFERNLISRFWHFTIFANTAFSLFDNYRGKENQQVLCATKENSDMNGSVCTLPSATPDT